VSQRWALLKHSCKPFCPACFDIIFTEIEVHQLPALSQHSCKGLCPGCSEVMIAAEIKVRQRWALRQNSCKPLCIFSFHVTARQLEFADVAPGCHCRELPQKKTGA
jgi:hypothetical protein